MLSSVLSLLHSLPIHSHVLSHARPTHPTPIFVEADVISAKRVPSQTMSARCVSSLLRLWAISSDLIERSSYWFQVEEVDTEFDSAKMVNFQPCWNRSLMEKLPTKSMSKSYFALSSQRIDTKSDSSVRRVAVLVTKMWTSPHPVFVSNFRIVPKAFFWRTSEVSLVGHKVIIHRPFTPVNGGV